MKVSATSRMQARRGAALAEETRAALRGTTFLNVSVHRFSDPESAADAMEFFSDQVINSGLNEMESPAIGERTRLLEGAPDGVPLSILYAQQGPIMYRIEGSTSRADGDPRPMSSLSPGRSFPEVELVTLT